MGDNQDQDRELRYVVKQYRDELEFLTGLNESVRKLVQVSRLVERIIKTHYAPEDFEKPMLGSLLHFQKGFLGGNFSQAAIGIDVRNQMSHDDARGFPNEARLGKGFEALSEIVEIHCLDLEKDLPAPPNPSVAGNSETAWHPRFKTDSEWTEAEPRAYVTQIERRPPPQLEATESDPDVSASTVAEYSFCPRAGILTHEGGFSDPEEELPSLALLPWYEQAAIEEAYMHALYVLFALPGGAGGGGCHFVVAYAWEPRLSLSADGIGSRMDVLCMASNPDAGERSASEDLQPSSRASAIPVPGKNDVPAG